MIDIHFIVNPIAGSGNNIFTTEYLQSYFNAELYIVKIKVSEYKGHPLILAQKSISQRANIIVACGGDGTINEVATKLVGTNIIFGIVPLGSGNGLASNLKIPFSIKNALLKIKIKNVEKIDIGLINSKPFFSNMGIGFDAEVIKDYEKFERRNFYSYLISSIKTLRRFKKNTKKVILLDKGKKLINPFMVFISNTNQMGYGISLTPKALLNDGKLDVVVIPEISKRKIILLGLLMLLKKTHLFKPLEYYQSNSIVVRNLSKKPLDSQIDGEYTKQMNDMLNIEILEQSLSVIV
ncbi:YegS/Rv2252/BmrU family lipid kinase [Cellulophaga sp. RHA19]|uniref:diacylglycerol/lipid kinase family protein n=1 Tax=Cellulophaga sp. RHA19 TaxID=1798237 RepID=UPI000C2C34C6|nr:diacylglycerol kinase family protein [Cellulophaga sp. RHA19]PKB44348.1 YegS/Rv2252/BmrU family lipid kinase [Cellulophaga sp. RHA19]